MSAKWKRDR